VRAKSLAEIVGKEEAERWKGGGVEPQATVMESPRVVIPKFQTTTEAEEWVRAQGLVSGDVSYKGFSMDAAQGFTEALAENVAADSRVAQAIDFFGNNRELNKLRREALRPQVEAEVRNRATWMKYLQGPGRIEKAIEAELKLHDVRMANNVYAMAAHPRSAGAKTSIFISYDMAHNPAKFLDAMQSDMALRFHPLGADTYKGIIDHEITHVLDHMLQYKLRNDGALHQLFLEHLPTMKDELSAYARQSAAEFVAEGWSEYRNNPTPRPLAASIGKRIVEILGGS
jgi:hypothetical protein